jgi:hypothetical protein
MTKVSNPISINCGNCFNDSLEISSTGWTLYPGLTTGNTVYIWIQDKFENQYMVSQVVGAYGSIFIDVTQFPYGMFTSNSGYFVLIVTSDSLGLNVLTLTFNTQLYSCYDFNIINRKRNCPIIPSDIVVSEVTFIPMTTIQRDAISNPRYGMTIYNSDSMTLEIYSNGVWSPFILNA